LGIQASDGATPAAWVASKKLWSFVEIASGHLGRVTMAVKKWTHLSPISTPIGLDGERPRR